MLQSISLTNFMSYSDCSLSFGKGIHSILGENGQGKSALLEAIPFALYGLTRTPTLADVIKEGTKTTEVVLTFLLGKKQVVVKRGIKGSGVSYAELSINGNIKASGQEVEKEVISLFSLSNTSFLLTTFFGLGSADNLLNVRSSERLETLQEIAGVDIFQKYLTEAKKRLSTLSDEAIEMSGVIKTLQELEDSGVNDKSLDEKFKEKRETEARLASLLAQRADVEEKLKTLDIFSNKLLSVSTKLAESKKNETTILDEIEEAQESQKLIVEQCADFRRKIDSYTQQLSKIDPEKISKKIEKIKEELQKSQFDLSLRKIVVGSGRQITKCPLCDHLITAPVKEKWKDEVKTLEESIVSFKSAITNLEEPLDNSTTLRRQVAAFEDKVKMATTRNEQYVNELSKLQLKKGKITSLITSLETELSSLKKKAQPINTLKEEKREVDRCVAEVQQIIASLDTSIEYIKKQSDKIKEAKDKKKQKIADLIQINKKKAALTLLVDCFGRYGIPLSLVSSLQDTLTITATSIYRKFYSGEIVADSVTERGKPGIDFVVRQPNGIKRGYKLLSEGQKVVVYFSLRLAISRIMRQRFPNIPDFLILDELTGRLSAKVCESLTATIASVLKKEFNQIFITSHVPLRNIFDKTIQITMEREGSVATFV